MRGAAASAATVAQQRALRPGESVWVAASAGTGKTKVLTDRLLALLLDGTDPARILCLTFTRAAAAEMANRVNQRLAGWATMPPGRLTEELVALTGRMPGDYELSHARQLFARILDVPGGARIATIHAFCQSLLRRFPLEAGVAPEFVVMEERDARLALAEAAEAVIAAAREDPGGKLAASLQAVARHAQEERFAELIAALAAGRGRVRAALADGTDALRRRLCRAFGVPHGTTRARRIAEFCARGAGDEAGLRAAAAALAAGSPSDRGRGLVLARWCADPAGRDDLLDPYIAAFLTRKNEVQQRLITKGAAKAAGGDPENVLRGEGGRVQRLQRDLAALTVIEATTALTHIGGALLDGYDRHKRLHGLLDYDDLVACACDLLQRPGVASWVLFKLDGGLDHILIDEAQDTNPEQWTIVKSLAEEFFAGDGAAGRPRTVFAVGDVKQSIYSFQRADPQAFVAMRRHFEERVNAARQGWAVVPLEISFRAAEPLLKAVDAVFAQAAAADGVALDGTAIRHVAARAGQAGLVELWPPVLPLPEEDPDPAEPGLPARRIAEPRTRLARAIAATIACWLERGERLEARGRDLRPGDVMVLVRRRNAFVGDLLRALKERGVPVAGADRLVLTGQLAVQDLVALGRFLLFPEDDLTLATILKGPLFGLSEDALFRLAYDRGHESLWTRLRRMADEDPAMRDAAGRLQRLLARADFAPPFELYAEILGARDGRRAMLERLGPEAADPIEEFLALALAYEREHVPSLQGFLRWLVAGEVEVKRDFGERQRDEVRILTVHGAKGLEAPIVFLPDTMQLPDRRTGIVWGEADGLPLWRPRAAFDVPYFTAERDALRRRDLQEYRRLLYVALTRAQDRLYVCGWETRRPATEAPHWHALCRAGWHGLAAPFAFDARPLIGEREGWHGEGLRLEAVQIASPVREAAPSGALRRGPLPAWVTAPPPPEPTPPRPLLPSRPSGPEPATLSPLAARGRDRFKRGLLVHRLLQSLPDLPAGERAAAARRFLGLPVHGLDADEQAGICAETLAVLNAPEFAEVWGPGSQSEVPVVGLIAGAAAGGTHALSGQIDRLVVTRERVLIVDFKTVRPPPATPEEVPALYLQQLAAYRAALARIYRDRPVECALLWTDGPRLMAIDAALLDRPLSGGLARQQVSSSEPAAGTA
ncbi:MAG TPA: double-strand break repair helicase AddA [Stellaceae bacterium]|nr:double-strand break repair helicase AddA [Stellaceae bacterium]